MAVHPWTSWSALVCVGAGLLLVAPAAARKRAPHRYDVGMTDADPRALARRYSEVTGRNVLSPTGVPGGKVTILAPRPVSRRTAARLLLGAFERLDLTLVRTGRLWRVVPLREAATSPLPLY